MNKVCKDCHCILTGEAIAEGKKKGILEVTFQWINLMLSNTNPHLLSVKIRQKQQKQDISVKQLQQF